MNGRPTARDLAGWPLTVPVPTAGRVYGLGRDASYDAARRGDLPGVVRIGRRLVVITATLRAALGAPETNGAGPEGPATATEPETLTDPGERLNDADRSTRAHRVPSRL